MKTPELDRFERRQIEVSLSSEQTSSLKPGDKLFFNILDNGQAVSKEIEITRAERIGEIYVIEGETKISPSGGGNLVTLEINPSDHQANSILF